MTTFGAIPTTDEVLAGVPLQGKRILVTGTSSGLGIETARALAARGAEVVGTARDLSKAAAGVIAGIREAAEATGGSFSLVELDLASLASVRACSDRLLAGARPFDIVIANAGVMAPPFGRTADGFETQFGTNHLGHFVLVNRIAALLGHGGRLVNLSSSGHHFADVDLDDPNFERTDYDPWVAYGRSKTANVLFAVEFDRRHRERGVRAAAVHPGSIRTKLTRYMSQTDEDALIATINTANAAAGLPPFKYKTVQQGAATSVWAATIADGEEIGGRYCEDCHVAELQEGEGINGGVRPYALNPERAAALWVKSELLVGEQF